METSEYEIMYRVEDSHWWYRALHRLILDRLARSVPDYSTRKILDAGCGTGALLERLGKSPHHLGIDLSAEAVRFCARRKLPQILQGNVNSIPLADGSLDAVICSSVLYHRWVPDVTATLREFYRSLKPGGVLILNLPAFESLHSVHDEKVFTARRFRREETSIQITAAGFDVTECTYWTSLLFPVVWLARRFGIVEDGRDFKQNRIVNHLMSAVMRLEFLMLPKVRFPAGVSILAVAKKPVGSEPQA